MGVLLNVFEFEVAAGSKPGIGNNLDPVIRCRGPIEVDVSGVKLVELVARSATTENEALPVTWGEAALTGS